MEFPNLFTQLTKEYFKIQKIISEFDYDNAVEYLSNHLPDLWVDDYHKLSYRSSNICSIQIETFTYLYDEISASPNNDSRLVAAFGKSYSRNRNRDDYRLKGWIGKTEIIFGEKWDKGHFIAHSIGGNVDGSELNVFQQRRDVNRGWSRSGKVYREMENYCGNHQGAFCFHRPLYLNQSSLPAYNEFGLLKLDKELWVECFHGQI